MFKKSERVHTQEQIAHYKERCTLLYDAVEYNMPVAIVTGANKGIGFGIVRALCKKFQGDVYLTARDEARGLVGYIC